MEQKKKKNIVRRKIVFSRGEGNAGNFSENENVVAKRSIDTQTDIVKIEFWLFLVLWMLLLLLS